PAWQWRPVARPDYGWEGRVDSLGCHVSSRNDMCQDDLQAVPAKKRQSHGKQAGVQGFATRGRQLQLSTPVASMLRACHAPRSRIRWSGHPSWSALRTMSTKVSKANGMTTPFAGALPTLRATIVRVGGRPQARSERARRACLAPFFLFRRSIA